jgi:hypothetical protein
MDTTRQVKIVYIHNQLQEAPIKHTAYDVYEKGSFLHVWDTNGKVYAYPVQHIWRVAHDAYGEDGKEEFSSPEQ